MSVTVNLKAVKKGEEGNGQSEVSDSRILGTLLSGLTNATAAAISATDSIIGALAKLQANVETKQTKLPSNGTSGQFLAHDMTFKTPAGGGSAGGAALSHFGCGYQGFLPPVGNYVDNAILNLPRSNTYLPVVVNEDITLPLMFSKNTPVDQIGMSVRPQASAGGYRFIIYDSLPDGAPDKVVYVSADIDVVSTNESYCATSLNFTFEAGKMYWYRFIVTTNTLLFRCVGAGNNLSFGNSGFFNSNSPLAERGNALACTDTRYPSVGSKFNGGTPISTYNIRTLTQIPRIVMRRA